MPTVEYANKTKGTIALKHRLVQIFFFSYQKLYWKHAMHMVEHTTKERTDYAMDTN